MISPAPRFRFSLRPAVFARRGLSVVELLAATVISLIVMGATVQLFGTVGSQITNGRSNIEAGDRLRTAIERLRKDLRGITVDLGTAWNRPESASGYFEIVKGPSGTGALGTWDKNQPTGAGNLLGYTADGLFFTTRSRDVPFVGRVQTNSNTPTTVESQVAEVAWFLAETNLNATNPLASSPQTTTPVTYTLYRRQLLVLPGVGTSVATGSPPAIAATTYTQNGVPMYDLSAHLSGGNMVLNSLADLEYRENRYSHSQTWPFQVLSPMPFQYSSTNSNMRYGEDVVLTNVLSFDVKVWDPGAPVYVDKNGTPIVPSDPGWGQTGVVAMSPPVYGAYVDLNWNNGVAWTNSAPGAPKSLFSTLYYPTDTSSNARTNSKLTYFGGTTFPVAGSATYDTWAAGYEAWFNGTPPGGQFGQSFNGFQDVSNGAGVDGPSEKITSPPYPVPLRGIQIKIRIYEPSSKQVREATIQESFVPN